MTPEVGTLYDALLKQRSVVPNMIKPAANIPALAQGIVEFLKPIVGDGALPGWYKELIAVRGVSCTTLNMASELTLFRQNKKEPARNT